MFEYNLSKQGNRKCTGNEGMIRKNEQHMSEEEKKYLKSMIKELDNLSITKHATEKELIDLSEIENIIKSKKYKMIDYNYNISNKEERIVLRTKQSYKVKDINGNMEDVYMKFVISFTTNTVITLWCNKVSDEKMKQNNLKNRYCENFDIIEKKIKL